MHSLIMFDMDGTIIDSFDGILGAYNETFEHYGMKTVTREECRELIGPKLYHTFHILYGLPDDKSKEMIAFLRKIYAERHMFNGRIYDGIEELLGTLKSNGHKLAIVTNKRYDCAEDIVRHKGLDRYFDGVYGMNFADDLEKSQLMDKCLSDFGVSGNDALMIGDSVYDSEAATKCKVDFAPVSYGFGIWTDRKTFADVKELTEYLVSVGDIIYK